MCKAKNASHIRTASTAAAEYPKAKTTNQRLHKIFDTTSEAGAKALIRPMIYGPTKVVP